MNERTTSNPKKKDDRWLRSVYCPADKVPMVEEAEKMAVELGKTLNSIFIEGIEHWIKINEPKYLRQILEAEEEKRTELEDFIKQIHEDVLGEPDDWHIDNLNAEIDELKIELDKIKEVTGGKWGEEEIGLLAIDSKMMKYNCMLDLKKTIRNCKAIKRRLKQIEDEDQIARQTNILNKIIDLLFDEYGEEYFQEKLDEWLRETDPEAYYGVEYVYGDLD